MQGQIEGNHARIAVSDNGKGWPKENRQRLLEPYMTTREKGTGLGLAIVAKIIEQHGGLVELVDAEPDANGRIGACVTFTLPLSSRRQDIGRNHCCRANRRNDRPNGGAAACRRSCINKWHSIF